LFNRGGEAATVTAHRKDLGKVHSKSKVRDVWQLRTVGSFGDSYSQEVPAHGAILLRIG